jgi:hypothetical protein
MERWAVVACGGAFMLSSPWVGCASATTEPLTASCAMAGDRVDCFGDNHLPLSCTFSTPSGGILMFVGVVIFYMAYSSTVRVLVAHSELLGLLTVLEAAAALTVALTPMVDTVLQIHRVATGVWVTAGLLVAFGLLERTPFAAELLHARAYGGLVLAVACMALHLNESSVYWYRLVVYLSLVLFVGSTVAVAREVESEA